MLDYPGTVYRKVIRLPWEKWFAWYPVKIRGRRVWLRTVYRRTVVSYIDIDKWSRVEYATLFDVIKGED
jgi:hypothetical protein